MPFTFSPDWVDESLNPKLAGCVKLVKNDPSKALRTFCLKNISLSYMGKQALSSHMDSLKHKNISTAFDTHYISSFFKIKQLQIKQQYANICPAR